MDNIQLCYIDNEINKIDKMKQGDVNSTMPRNYSRTRAWGCAANAGGWLPAQTDVMSWCPVNGTGSSRRRKPPKSS